jgi:DNA-binding NarL/FixJ family response regulator
MPDLDGVAATAEIRARRPAISVIGYSSAADQEIGPRFLRVGASAFVDKADRVGLAAELQKRRIAAKPRRYRRTDSKLLTDWSKRSCAPEAAMRPTNCLGSPQDSAFGACSRGQGREANYRR